MRSPLRTLAAGYSMHVPKPVDPAELATIVASLARPGGTVVVSTISRSLKAYALAVVAAE